VSVVDGPSSGAIRSSATHATHGPQRSCARELRRSRCSRPGRPRLAWTGGGALPQERAEYRDSDLPPPDTKRWVTRRKAMIVNAVRAGVISLEGVCRRYELSVEEFLAWQRAIDTHGVPGLRVTRLQIYRDNLPSRVAKPRS
jgi:hypothetical protein